MGKLITILVLVSILVSVVAVAGCAPAPTEPSPENPAPDFQLKNLDGQNISLSGLRGSSVMLNFWATWCGPCRGEMPYIQEVFADAEWKKRGLVLLTINVGEDPATVTKFMKENGLTFTVLLDTNQSVARDYNIRGIPTTFFIDKNGIIKDMKIGAFSGKAEIDRRLANSIFDVD